MKLPLRAALTALAACSLVAPPTHVLVSHTPTGDRALHEEGNALTIRRWDLGVSGRGLTRGYVVVKSEAEWRALWPNTDIDKIPLLPPDIHFAQEMLLVLAPPPEDHVLTAEVKDVIDTEQTGIHVYALTTLPGVDCPAADAEGEERNYALARIPRIDGKEVRFHLDAQRSDPCGRPPQATVGCRPNGTTTPFQGHLSVQPGTGVACVAGDMTAARPILDRTWSFVSLPSGSFAKAAVSANGLGVSFNTDVFGTYKVELEITDDLQRKGAITTDIDVSPPRDSLALQMVWTKFDPNDDPSTFPRVELHAAPVPPEELPKRAGIAFPPPVIAWGTVKDCNAGASPPPPGCTAKLAASTTLMTLDPGAAKQYAIAVRYGDERVQGQPVLCVRVYRNGKMQTQMCDPSTRKEGAWWEAGSVDAMTGETPDALAQEQAAAAAKAAASAPRAAAAAGADAGSVGDGGGDGGKGQAKP